MTTVSHITRRSRRRALGIPRTLMEFPVPQPTTPLSSNVVPVNFESWRAARRGVGRPAVLAAFKTFGSYKAKPKRDSSGVIWNGRPYWWSEKGYYRRGKDSGVRPPLQHEVWSHSNGGKPIPRMHEIFFRDRNRNNFDPANLELLSKADLHKRTVALGEVKQISLEERRKIAGKRWHRQSRRAVTSLLKQFNQKDPNAQIMSHIKR